MNQALVLDYQPALSLPQVLRFRKPELPPDLGIMFVGVLFGTIVTLLEAEILARVCTHAAIGIARCLGYT
jgi:hypothetical protein